MGNFFLKRAGNPVAHARTQGLNITNFGPCGKYGSRPLNGTTLGRYIHRRQFKGRVLRPYWKTTLFKGLREFHEETLSQLDIQYRSSTRRMIYRVRTSLHFLPHSSMCRTQHDRRQQTLRKPRGSDDHCTEYCVVTC